MASAPASPDEDVGSGSTVCYQMQYGCAFGPIGCATGGTCEHRTGNGFNGTEGRWAERSEVRDAKLDGKRSLSRERPVFEVECIRYQY